MYTYLNNLPNYMKIEAVVIYVVVENLEMLQDWLNNTGNRFTSWCRLNRLIVNTDKSILIHFFDRKRINIPIRVLVDNIYIQPSETTKFRGFILILSCTGKNTSCRITYEYQLQQLNKVLGLRALMDIYYATVNSIFMYNITLWRYSTEAYSC